MKSKDLKKLKDIFKAYREVKLVYFFGSKAKGESGPLSDYDFAVYIETQNKKIMQKIRFELMDKFSRTLKTDKIDVIILNLTKSPDLKYAAIKESKIIYEQDLYRVIVEPRIMNEYFDFNLSLSKHGLTKIA